MILRDFHVHTTFSDGKNTPEEMVQAAIRKGMDSIGFSDHSYTDFDESFCIPKEKRQEYVQTIAALKKAYQGQIRIYCGIEQDLFSGEETGQYDYVIGSVHYVQVDGHYISVDESKDAFLSTVDTYFGGDPIAFAQAYFENVAQVAEKTHADIIGHFDLIAKFNDAGLFDESDPRYIAAWQRAADRLLPYGKPFEINTGAISRGYKRFPYPSGPMIRYIRQRGGKFIPSSDAHSIQNLCFGFETLEELG